MADFTLSDVDVVAVSLCKGPANRKRIFLRKSEVDEKDLLTVTEQVPLIKVGGDDWRVVYTVVAEPDWEEQAGSGEGAEVGKTDVWENEQEILKAAHSFMRNGGLINFQHQGQNACGRVVENFVAHGDMTVDSPEGVTVIKKGSWVVGIEPDDLMRRMIEDGTIEGVSYEGVGTRTTIAKATQTTSNTPSKDPSKKGAAYRVCKNCGAKMGLKAGKCPSCGKSYVSKMAHEPTVPPGGPGLFRMKGKQLPAYIQHVFNDLVENGHPHEGATYRLAIGIVKNWARGSDGKGGKVNADTQAKAVAAIAEWEKLKTQAKADNLKKSVPSGGTMNLLTKIAKAVGVSDEDLQDNLSDEEKALLAQTDTLSGEGKTEEENDVPLTDEQKQALEQVPSLTEKIEGTESKVVELTKDDGRLAALEANVAAILERLPSKDEEQSEEEQRTELEKSVEKLQADLHKAEADLAKLAEGDTAQGRTDLKKSDNPDADLATALLG
jgi:hypothetical protein